MTYSDIYVDEMITEYADSTGWTTSESMWDKVALYNAKAHIVAECGESDAIEATPAPKVRKGCGGGWQWVEDGEGGYKRVRVPKGEGVRHVGPQWLRMGSHIRLSRTDRIGCDWSYHVGRGGVSRSPWTTVAGFVGMLRTKYEEVA